MMEKDKLQPELSTPFLRLGKSSRINPQVYTQSVDQRLPLDLKTSSLQEHLSNLYDSVSLVATTCLGVNHAAITTKRQPDTNFPFHKVCYSYIFTINVLDVVY